MFHLPSYQECQRICESSDSFYESKFFYDGYQISIFNYRLATYQDFLNYKSFELRGLTFVFNLDGTVYNRFLLMEKFFNLNENESVLYEIVKYKKIKSVYSKEDGSIISFIKLPNDKVLAKSKASLESEQALMAQEIYESDPQIKQYVDYCLSIDLMPIFELVSPRNQVVIKYEHTKLVLLRLRNNQSGQYLPIDEVIIDKPLNFKFSLNDLLALQKSLEGMEGWVVEFEDNQKVKIKTTWYLSLHKIYTDYSNREDYLIDLILDNKIDDVLSQLDFESPNRKFVEAVIDKTNLNLERLSFQLDDLISKFAGDKKQFALNYKHLELFPLAAKILSGHEKFDVLVDYIKKKTYRLNQARLWLDLGSFDSN